MTIGFVEPEVAIVYLAPTAGRRYLTKKAAETAEARALLLKDCDCDERAGPCGLHRLREEDPAKWHRLVEEKRMELFHYYHEGDGRPLVMQWNDAFAKLEASHDAMAEILSRRGAKPPES